MGLVSTWLNGIGLRSVVPTFEAAGIVSPSHLADLDVSYFESLGVTDPDDRRKLFYLVQRIKLAVNNKKDYNSKNTIISVEQRVDAVVSENFVNEDEESKKQNSKGDDDDYFSAEETSKPFFGEEKKVEVELVRRSKRIRASLKKKLKKVKSKGKKDGGTERTSPTLPVSTRKISCISTTNNITADEQRKTEKKLVQSPPRSPSKRSPTKKSSSKLVKEKEEKGPSRTQVFSCKSSIPSASSASNSPSNFHNTDGIDDEDNEQTNSEDRTDLSRGTRNHFPTQQQPESKLPVSKRPCKKLSATSTEKNSSQNSVVKSSYTLPNNQIDDVEFNRSDVSNLKARRRVTLASNNGPLANTFHSFGNELSTKQYQYNYALELAGENGHSGNNIEADSKRGESGSVPRISTNRPSKSMCVSESVLLQQYQRGHQKRSSMSSAIVKPALFSKSERMTTTTNRNLGIPTPSPPGITQVRGEAVESWAAKIDVLREDNDTEHELFRDQVEDESQYQEYYDMRIKVIVRKRPLNKSESLTGGIDIIHPLDYGSYGKTLVYQPKTRVDLTKEVETVPFAFDNVFDESSTNIGIYNRSLRNLVEPFFKGQWATVFAYGQTGSGKTYTMMGSNITGVNAGTATVDESNLGLYYLAALDIFDMIKLPEYSHLNVHVSLFEIYGGKLFDLLNDRKQIKCLEDSKGKVCYPGLTEHSVHVPEHVMHLIEEGSKSRSTGTTSRNADSSRSHAVLQIKLVKNTGRKKNVEHGRFSFIDLAGSERGADTSNASKATRLEGAEINQSLLALKEVIRALATGGSMTHIPFRGSKLTQVLKDSFVGDNSRCCMVACISPDIGNCEQTLNTLRYADRVKERNPETGVLSMSCQQPTKISSSQSFRLTAKSHSSQLNRNGIMNRQYRTEKPIGNEKNYLYDVSVEETDFSESFLPNLQTENVSYKPTFSEKQRSGQALVSNHRSVMSRWLSMVKDEMNLVNQVDADREGLGDYILKLQNVQRSQIGFLSELRSSLQKYVRAAEGPHETTAGQDDDDSFEDLRD